MRESIREFTIVGEEQETRTFKIQPTNTIESRVERMLDQINRARTTFRITVCAHHSAWLEENDVHVLFGRLKSRATDTNIVLRKIHPRRQRVDEVSIHHDFARKDECFAFTPRCNACVGHHALQPLATTAVGEFVGVLISNNPSVAHRVSVRCLHAPLRMHCRVSPYANSSAERGRGAARSTRTAGSASRGCPLEEPAGAGTETQASRSSTIAACVVCEPLRCRGDCPPPEP